MTPEQYSTSILSSVQKRGVPKSLADRPVKPFSERQSSDEISALVGGRAECKWSCYLRVLQHLIERKNGRLRQDDALFIRLRSHNLILRCERRKCRTMYLYMAGKAT